MEEEVQHVEPEVGEDQPQKVLSDPEEEKQVRTMGTLRSVPAEPEVKEFYSRDEAMRFSRKDFDRDPALFRAVVASMQKW